MNTHVTEMARTHAANCSADARCAPRFTARIIYRDTRNPLLRAIKQTSH